MTTCLRTPSGSFKSRDLKKCNSLWGRLVPHAYTFKRHHGTLFPDAWLLSCPFAHIWAQECLIHMYVAKRSTWSGHETMNSHEGTQSICAEARDWDRDSWACDNKAPSSGERPASSRLNRCFSPWQIAERTLNIIITWNAQTLRNWAHDSWVWHSKTSTSKLSTWLLSLA